MSEFTFEPVKAERKRAKARIACMGAAGSGKTHSSLLISASLGEKILLIDTENHSGEMEVGKAGIPDYFVQPIEAPYDPDKLIEIISAAEKADFDVIIIDSLSHFWAGSGGLLDQQGKIADRGVNSFAAWRKITPKHNKLVDSMLASRCHILATMRSKQEYVLEENDRGKKAPRKVGLAPVQRDGLEYEFTVVFDIDQKTHTAVATKDRTSLFPADDSFKISRETGRRINEWLLKGVAEKAPSKEVVELPKETIKAATTSAITKDPQAKDDTSALKEDRVLSKSEKNKLVILAKKSGYDDVVDAIKTLLGTVDGELRLSDAKALIGKLKEDKGK